MKIHWYEYIHGFQAVEIRPLVQNLAPAPGFSALGLLFRTSFGLLSDALTPRHGSDFRLFVTDDRNVERQVSTNRLGNPQGVCPE